MPNSAYELLDFGDGEKLERFGEVVVRRPCLYASNRKFAASLWRSCDVEFDERNQSWSRELRQRDWHVEIANCYFGLKPTPVGHLGIFPEQALNWNWIQNQFVNGIGGAQEPLKALNLFAYTGGTTMALARCGVEVVHLDGAANTVSWARENANQSGLAQAKIRWIVEDTMRFLRREIKRGNRYDILVADPPSFGRGPKKEQWKIQRDLPDLLESLPLLLPEPKAVVLSCHTEGYDCDWMADALCSVIECGPGRLEKLQLTLETSDGRKLESGDCVRWIAD